MRQERNKSMQRLEPADPAALKTLKKRTKALASPPESSLLEEGAERLLVFKAGGRSFAFPSDQVRRVAAAPRVFPLPGLPPHIPGVANILGEILPVADLCLILGIETEPFGPEAKLIILEEGPAKLGLLAKEVEGMRELPRSDLHSSPFARNDALSRYAAWALLDGTVVLDKKALLGGPFLAAGEE